MPRDPRLRSVRSPWLPCIAGMGIALALLSGCGSKSSPTSPGGGGGGGGGGTTTFTGVITGPTESGKITLTISTTTPSPTRAFRSAATVAASGSVKINGGAAIAMSGTYDLDTHEVNAAGGGYTFVGAYDSQITPPAITGLYNGPNGQGYFVCPAGDGNAVKAYCGTFHNAGQTSNGSWNFLVSGTNIIGLSWAAGDPGPLYLTGTMSGTGTTRTIALEGITQDGVTVSATGSLNTSTNAVNGTWTVTDGTGAVVDNGTWSGSACP